MQAPQGSYPRFISSSRLPEKSWRLASPMEAAPEQEGRWNFLGCHLIGFQLTGENANKQNLITGTRYMNVDGMLPFENMVADYVKETENPIRWTADRISASPSSSIYKKA